MFPSVALRDKDRSRILLYDLLGKKARASQGARALLGSDKASRACWRTGDRRRLRARSRELTDPSRGSHKSLPEKSVRKFNSFAGQVSDWLVTPPNRNKLAARYCYQSHRRRNHIELPAAGCRFPSCSAAYFLHWTLILKVLSFSSVICFCWGNKYSHLPYNLWKHIFGQTRKWNDTVTQGSTTRTSRKGNVWEQDMQRGVKAGSDGGWDLPHGTHGLVLLSDPFILTSLSLSRELLLGKPLDSPLALSLSLSLQLFCPGLSYRQDKRNKESQWSPHTAASLPLFFKPGQKGII